MVQGHSGCRAAAAAAAGAAAADQFCGSRATILRQPRDNFVVAVRLPLRQPGPDFAAAACGSRPPAAAAARLYHLERKCPADSCDGSYERIHIKIDMRTGKRLI